MGVDPITMAVAAQVGSSIIGGIGNARAQSAANARFKAGQAQGQSMMHTGPSEYETALMKLLGQTPAAPDQNANNIDVGSILGNFNTGQDALSQFLRADPSNKFDASGAFDMLQQLDARNTASAVSGLNANFNSLGSRFGSAAAQKTSDLLANINAQTGSRNAGILQSSFENAANRRLTAAQGIAQNDNAIAQLAAQLGMANQQNEQFNLGQRQQNFQNQFNTIQAGFGMQNARDSYNAQLFSIMQGIAAPQGNAYTAVGQTGSDLSQLLMFLPMIRQISNAPPGGARPGYQGVGGPTPYIPAGTPAGTPVYNGSNYYG